MSCSRRCLNYGNRLQTEERDVGIDFKTTFGEFWSYLKQKGSSGFAQIQAFVLLFSTTLFCERWGLLEEGKSQTQLPQVSPFIDIFLINCRGKLDCYSVALKPLEISRTNYN